jgi:hypothetical protein
MDNEEGTILQQINITASCSLIKLTAILVPGCIHSLHSQCIQWIFDHGSQAVVTTSTLCTHNATPPISLSPIGHGFADPAPLPSSTVDESPFSLSIPADGESWSQVMDDDGDHKINDDILDKEVVNPEDPVLEPAVPISESDAPKMPTCILDDAFNFMDHLL